jgi:hypothetical protein
LSFIKKPSLHKIYFEDIGRALGFAAFALVLLKTQTTCSMSVFLLDNLEFNLPISKSGPFGYAPPPLMLKLGELEPTLWEAKIKCKRSEAHY